MRLAVTITISAILVITLLSVIALATGLVSIFGSPTGNTFGILFFHNHGALLIKETIGYPVEHVRWFIWSPGGDQ